MGNCCSTEPAPSNNVNSAPKDEEPKELEDKNKKPDPNQNRLVVVGVDDEPDPLANLQAEKPEEKPVEKPVETPKEEKKEEKKVYVDNEDSDSEGKLQKGRNLLNGADCKKKKTKKLIKIFYPSSPSYSRFSFCS